MGAGPLQTSYGKEVPAYSPLAQGATLHLMEAIVFHREPDLWSSEKCLQRRFYNILIIFANKFHQESFPLAHFLFPSVRFSPKIPEFLLQMPIQAVLVFPTVEWLCQSR